jgi:hypothetical protein
MLPSDHRQKPPHRAGADVDRNENAGKTFDRVVAIRVVAIRVVAIRVVAIRVVAIRVVAIRVVAMSEVLYPASDGCSAVS